jgi:hypothetical protein
VEQACRAAREHQMGFERMPILEQAERAQSGGDPAETGLGAAHAVVEHLPRIAKA